MAHGNTKEKRNARARMAKDGVLYTTALMLVRREHAEALARDRASQTGETFGEALRVVLALRDGHTSST